MTLINVLNALLPFTEPSTPLWRDIIHTLALCIILYLAPNLQYERDSGRFRWVSRQEFDVAHSEQVQEIAYDQEGPDSEPEHPVRAEMPDGGAVEQDDVPETGHHDGTGFQVPALDPEEAEVEAGPADGQAQRRRDANRENIGAKKAKSLARRNQQRAYNEWLREQGEAERADWARDAEKRQEELQMERERRTLAEEKIQERERRAREQRKAEEEKSRTEEIEAVSKAYSFVMQALDESAAVRIEEVAKLVRRDAQWAQQLLKRDGVLGTKIVDGKKVVTMLTGQGWAVRIDENVMEKAYQRAATWKGNGDGKVSWEQLGRIVQETLRDDLN